VYLNSRPCFDAGPALGNNPAPGWRWFLSDIVGTSTIQARNSVNNIERPWSSHRHRKRRRRLVSSSETEMLDCLQIQFLRPLFVTEAAMVTGEPAISICEE